MANLFEEFLKRVLYTKKINPQMAFDLARDTQFKALCGLLIKKGIVTQTELDYQLEQEFSKITETIEKIPLIPKA